MIPNCFNHQETEAVWFCSRCGKYWCGQCAPPIKGVCKSFSFYPECRDFCEKPESGEEKA